MPHEQIVKIKLGDTQLRQNLTNAMHTLQKNRLNVINAKFNNWQGLRDKAKKAKNNALMSLSDRLIEFEKNATKNGIKVHWASSATDDRQKEGCGDPAQSGSQRQADSAGVSV